MQACRPLLGTYVEIRIGHARPEAEATAMDRAFQAIMLVQSLMSLREASSDLAHLNRAAHLEPRSVHPWTRQVLERAVEIHRASEGLFDCNVAQRLADWGLLPSTVVAPGQTGASMDDLVFHPDGRVGAHRRLSLDLGGIAKGFAVDKAAEVLMAEGVQWAVVNAGGDLRVVGDVEEAIHVRDPRNPSQLHFLGSLRDGAVATSGSYFSKELASVPNKSALVNPRSGQPVVSDRSYSVIAPDCMTADALTKVLALTGNADHLCFARFQAHALIV
ncbi:MAG TPA: FAD:protein FMN transferase [Rhodocyclaceae bacterium]|nr:FAD:protein FMN transferase [Rhodocyclaceae bacterium]